jgi:predicted  nucleic acid-binding Zn-ribbon protein
MTDVTAQAFREAAEQITRVRCPDTKDLDEAADLLLAAAEQREQLNELRIAYGEAMVALTEQGDAYVTQREQIATLTAERDAAIHHVHLLTQKLYDLGGSCFPVPE